MKKQATLSGYLLAFGEGKCRMVSSGSLQDQQRSSKGQGFLVECEVDIFVHSLGSTR
jgi:hypothetical protein